METVVNPKAAVAKNKPEMFAVPPIALLELGKAMQDGANKYGCMNFRETPIDTETYYNAIFRHLMCWRDGEDCAEDSGCHHLAHVMACCAIILDTDHSAESYDTRFTLPNGAASWWIENEIEKRTNKDIEAGG